MDEGLHRLIEKANQGDIEAMTMVGDCYLRGFHTDKDDKTAHYYYQMAADRGHVKAACMVAIDYMTGTGVKKDKAKGLEYFKFSADNGHAEAQYYLGALYQSGQAGLFFKTKRAAEYFEKAAIQGHAKAQIELGNIHVLTDGIQYSLEIGLFWLCCAYLHGESATEESRKAKDALNTLLTSGLPGGRKRIDEIMETVKSQYPSYMRNPE